MYIVQDAAMLLILGQPLDRRNGGTAAPRLDGTALADEPIEAALTSLQHIAAMMPHPKLPTVPSTSGIWPD